MGTTHSKSKKIIRNFSKHPQIRNGDPDEFPATAASKSYLSLNIKPNRLHALLPLSPMSSRSCSPLETLNKDKDLSAIIIAGRRYEGNIKCVMPNDEKELDRLVQSHFIYKYLFDGNFSAPIRDLLLSKQKVKESEKTKHISAGSWTFEEEPPPRVLDIACGDGTWLLEMATEFPNSPFYGVDTLANYPTSIKPANTFFSQKNILDGFQYPDDYFDFIFMRQVYTCFSRKDWITIIKEIDRLLKPGGYVEFRDVDPMFLNMGPISKMYFENYPALMEEIYGVDISWARNMFDYLKGVGGFTDMHRQTHSLNFDTKGPMGETIIDSFRSALDSYRGFFQAVYNANDEEYNKAIDDMTNECIKNHSSFNYYSCWGRKSLFCRGSYNQQDKAHVEEPHIHDIIRPTTNSSTSQSVPKDSCIYSKGDVFSTSLVQPRCVSMNICCNYPDQEHISKTSTECVLCNNCDSSRSSRDFSIFPWEQSSESLDPEDVSNIDQFAEGYEDC